MVFLYSHDKLLFFSSKLQFEQVILEIEGALTLMILVIINTGVQYIYTAETN